MAVCADPRPAPGGTYALLSDAALSRWIELYAAIAHSGRTPGGTLLCQRDLDAIQMQLRSLRAERYQRFRKGGAR